MTPLQSSIAQQFCDVLGLESVALSDNFFADLGGHSMLATRLVVRLRESIGLELPLRVVFDAPTPALLAAAVERISDDKFIDAEHVAASETRRNGESTASIPRHDTESGDYPLSFSQERLWFLDQLTPGNPFYNISSAQRIPFAVNHSILERALSALVRRHGALRTIFPLVAEEPVQRVLPPEDAQCALIDLGPVIGPARDAELQRIATESAQKSFDLANGPLYRATLVRLGPFESAFVFIVHHIIADNVSLNVIFRELGSLYSDEAAGRRSSLADAPLQYADFSVWQRNWMNAERLAPELAYWQQQLNNLGPLNLPTDRPRPPVQTYRGGLVPLTISSNTRRSLYAIARESSATPFMLLLTAFYVLLNRYSQQDDLAAGVPIANRNHQELENVVGFFPNTLVMRVDLQGNPTFRSALARVREVALDAFSHQDVPFAAVVASMRLPQDLSRNPLFQVSFQLISQDEKSSGSGAAAEVVFDRGTAIFDLTLNLWEEGEEIRGHFEYNKDLFDEETVNRISRHFQTLLDSLTHNPELPVASLAILSSEERRQMLVDWNDNRAEVPPASLHSLVEAQVRLTPNAVALRKDTITLTYAELDRHASSHVHRLQQFDPKPQRAIGVMLPPSFEMVIAILGILKSGNAYVPLDPATPRKRLLRMLDDAGVQLLITSGALADLVPERHTLVMDLDESIADVESAQSSVKPSDTAYIIFTSGSTGIPKGVMIPHRAVVNYLTWCRGAYPVDKGIGAPLCSPLSSDMSVTSLFLPLICGRSVVLLDQDDVVESLDSALRSDLQFSFVKLTPAHLEALRSLSLGREVPANTAAFIVGGEQLLSETLALWRDEAPELQIFNEYGPTETTVGCVVHPTRAGDLAHGPVPIGRPIANTRLYVLDRHKQPVPIGVPGELYIGGAGVALGYAGAPELTAERFLPDPFAPGNGLIYRTGDSVRYRADGTLEFLGRVDAQVKIRGFRIEPGDIETAIRRHSAVEDVVVTVRDLGTADKRLIAYVVAKTIESEPGIIIQELRDSLRQELPVYMLPSALLLVDAIPLTTAGKIDLRALERNSSAEHARIKPKISPATTLERLIAHVVENVFGVESLSANDDFFADLGGHSLLVTRVVARLRDYLGFQLPLRWVFQAPTVKDLAQSIASHDAQEAEVAERNAGIVLAVLEMSDEQVRTELSATGD
ncbi:MAG TPA: amino acid adenylation domain-containing protein, partial [Pyrinomonadaceae bacterium]|nr:amino acid adenylation domain-containing protein [Pyrinomonadaceae bacterium]